MWTKYVGIYHSSIHFSFKFYKYNQEILSSTLLWGTEAKKKLGICSKQKMCSTMFFTIKTFRRPYSMFRTITRKVVQILNTSQSPDGNKWINPFSLFCLGKEQRKEIKWFCSLFILINRIWHPSILNSSGLGSSNKGLVQKVTVGIIINISLGAINVQLESYVKRILLRR